MSKKNVFLAILLTALVALGVGIICAYLFFNNQNDPDDSPTNQTVAVDNTNQANANVNNSDETNVNINADINENINSSTIVVGEPTIEVIDNPGISFVQGMVDDTSYKFYSAGLIPSGKYQGQELVLLVSNPNFPAIYPYLYRFVKQDGQLTLLSQHSSDATDVLENNDDYIVDNDTIISELNYPATIIGANSRQVLTLQSEVNVIFDSDYLKLDFADSQWGNVYTTNEDSLYDASNNNGVNEGKNVLNEYGFYIQAFDGTAQVYKLELDFLVNENVPSIIWSDSTSNSTPYSFTTFSGCGAENYMAVVDVGLDELNVIGQTSKGDDVYELIDENNSLLTDYYNNTYQSSYDGTQPKVPYSEYLASRPMIFLVDSFGRMVRGLNNDYLPLAECGKPVIYLYPEQTTDVSVQVNPGGGITVSDPAYNNGWTVKAEPNGNLYNYADNKNYPSLYWEGRSSTIYQTPNKGFVVAKDQVPALIIDKLTAAGLNEQEIADFKEFWLPRLSQAPYYFITFLGTHEMNLLAPLSIEPKPDTVIRIFMDYIPLEQPIEVQGYNIPRTERTGFTVVEWGGALK